VYEPDPPVGVASMAPLLGVHEVTPVTVIFAFGRATLLYSLIVTVEGVEPLSSETTTKYVLPEAVPARPVTVTGVVKAIGPTLKEPLMIL
jgi:hypothetical protein